MPATILLRSLPFTSFLGGTAWRRPPEKWRADYTWPVVDKPTAIVTVDLAGDGSPPVEVRDYPLCHDTHDGSETPEALCDLERAIDKTADTAAYVECASPDGGPTYGMR